MSTPLEFLTCYILVQISANNQRDISRVSSLVVTCNKSKTSVMSTPLVKSTSLNNSGDSPVCQRSKSNFQRRASQVKFGCHLATPAQVPSLNKRSPGVQSSCTSTPHVIAMVGLPARGKTYISKKLSRYLNWIEINTGEIAVFDATNTTRERRRLLHQRIVVEKGFKLFFVESICNDDTIVESNIKEVKTASPDYVNVDEERVMQDFKKRIQHYQEQYQTLDETLESDFSFMKIYDC